MSKHPLYNSTGLQKNNKSHVLYALANKKMELKRLEDEYSAKLLKLQNDISALETTICLFDGDCRDTIAKIDEKVSKSNGINRSKATRNSYFKKGECKMLVLSMLRESDIPLDTSNIAMLLAEKKGLELDKNSLTNLQKTVLNTLSKCEQSGLISKVGKNSNNFLWGIKELNH